MIDNTRIRQLAHQHLTGDGAHCIINFARALIEEAVRSTVAAPLSTRSTSPTPETSTPIGLDE